MNKTYFIFALCLTLYLGIANHYGWVVGESIFSQVERPGATTHK